MDQAKCSDRQTNRLCTTGADGMSELKMEAYLYLRDHQKHVQLIIVLSKFSVSLISYPLMLKMSTDLQTLILIIHPGIAISRKDMYKSKYKNKPKINQMDVSIF